MYTEDEYCDYHHIKGHATRKFMQLKHYIQDLKDKGEIEIEGPSNTSPSQGLGIYQSPFPKRNQQHTQGQDSNTNTNYHKTPVTTMIPLLVSLSNLVNGSIPEK